MTQPVIRGVSYCLVHAPTMLLHHGTSPAMERRLHPASQYLERLPQHLRSYEQALAYPPNQAYLGRIRPEALAAMERPWFEQSLEGAEREAPYGELMPEDEFLALMKIVDVFDLVQLEAGFAAAMAERLASHPLWADSVARLGQGKELAELERLLAEQAAPLYLRQPGSDADDAPEGRLVGVVRRAHEQDESLSSTIMLENLVTKASAVLGLKQLFARTGLRPEEVEYLIECSEEACGDMNQRGGGNFAKAIGEMAGCINATGSDTRAFCAGPTHALIEAAALVQAGVFKHVVVLAGGTPAKLGLNSRDHVAKGLPVLEDLIGAFAIHVAADDYVSPRIRLDMVGRHKIGSGSSPQAVMEALVTEPLDRAGLGLRDVARYGVEMQNPELTEPAGAGDVPKSNYRLLGALAVKRGEIERSEIPAFVEAHGVPGFAPTQGHIPSGVPLIGPIREAIMAGEYERAMIIGKGSLFLARMTNLFDGVSVLLDRNPGRPQEQPSPSTGRVRVGITLHGSELGEDEVLRGAEAAQRQWPDLEVVLIGTPSRPSRLTHLPADSLEEGHRSLERLLAAGELAAGVTLHYPFPIGVATVGRVVTPGRGREMLIASTTGTAAVDRVEGMLRSALYGAAVAKSLGLSAPTVGLLNLEGAPQVERLLNRLRDGGYPLHWAGSGRADGGALMRGNDVLAGGPDVLVTDSLTGNLLMKLLSAHSTGGSYEATGFGYGPGVGEGYGQILHIISRASGAPVIAGAIRYAAETARGGLLARVGEEMAAARAAGLERLLQERLSMESPALGSTAQGSSASESSASQGSSLQSKAPGLIQPPPEKVVTAEIAGVEILRLEEAVEQLWSRGIYARSGMGCTGPVILVAPEDLAAAREALQSAGLI